jgi:calcium uniporter protein, mitochondrial
VKKETQIETGLRGRPGEGGVESYSGLVRKGSSTNGETKFVRWSSSTEIGDFIRRNSRSRLRARVRRFGSVFLVSMTGRITCG